MRKWDWFDYAGVVITILVVFWGALLFLNHIGEIPKEYKNITKDILQYTLGPICLFGGIYLGLRSN